MPIGYYTTGRQIEYFEKEYHLPVPPTMLQEYERGFKIGGVTYGAHLVWSKDF